MAAARMPAAAKVTLGAAAPAGAAAAPLPVMRYSSGWHASDLNVRCAVARRRGSEPEQSLPSCARTQLKTAARGLDSARARRQRSAGLTEAVDTSIVTGCQ